MPPRKKTKLSSRAPSSPSVGTPKETTPAAATKASQEATRPVLDPDPWTDDQEAVLFKNLVRYKPVGLHKHTRMVCILINLRRYGWQDEHISRRGVWQKLDTLYSMETLHEREDADEFEQEDAWVEFWLPSAEFGEAMFSRRINLKRSSSPPTLHHQLSYRGGADSKRRTAAEEWKKSTSEAHKSSPEPEWESGRDGERRKSLRGRGGRGGRGISRTQSEVTSRKRKRAESQPQIKEGENQEESESGEEEDEEDDEEEGEEEDGDEEQQEDDEGDEDNEDDEDDEDGDDDENGEDEEESDAEEEPSVPATRGGRGRSTRNNPPRGRGGAGAGGGRGGGKTRGGRGGRATPRGRPGRGGRARGR